MNLFSITYQWQDSVLHVYENQRSKEVNDDIGTFMATLCLIIIVIAVIIFWIYFNRQNKKWQSGFFPENLRFTKGNVLEAYICFAAYIVSKDKRNYREKISYLNSYFLKYFREETYHFGDSFSSYLQHPIDPKSVAVWINKHIKEETKKIQIIYFLVGVSFVDGQMIENEYLVLKEIIPLLQLSQKDLDAVVNMYKFDEDKKKAKTAQSASSSYSSSYKKEMALKILGLELNAKAYDVKAAYRKLVKIHHPDRFSNESKEQQVLAHEKFLKIQEAYEYLDKFL